MYKLFILKIRANYRKKACPDNRILMFIGSENSEFLFLNDFFAKNLTILSSHFDKVMFQLKIRIVSRMVRCVLSVE